MGFAFMWEETELKTKNKQINAAEGYRVISATGRGSKAGLVSPEWQAWWGTVSV